VRKQFILGIIISVILLVFIFWNTDIQALKEAMLSANYWYLAPSVLITFICMWLRAIRWQWLLAPIKKIGVHSLFSATMIGFMANNVLPARLGEFVRAYVIGRHENIPKSASFGTIVVERIFDGLVLLSFLIFSFMTQTALPDWVIVSGYVVGGIYIVSLTFLFCLVIRPDGVLYFLVPAIRMISLRTANRVESLIRTFIDGLQILKQGFRMIMILILSLILWFIFAFSIQVALMGFNHNLPFTASLLIMAILGFGVTIPSSPGFVGTFHASCVVGLALFSVSQSDAVSFSIVYHASQYIPVTVVGLVYLWMDHLSLKDIGGVDVVS
jgi:uncharacterized protein (TIRG00374 family)